MTRISLGTSVALLAIVALLLALPAAHLSAEQDSPEATETSEESIQKQLDEKLAERRKAMIEEAHSALDETNDALAALDAGNSKQALDALARVTGRLELIVARDPQLALAPVDVSFTTHDLYATPEAIRKALSSAEDMLDDGKVQQARALLSGLASEIVIRVANLPLATYPAAIKAISPMIDAGETEQAKAALRAALSTVVVTNHVISLPVLRARHLLDVAEQRAGQEESSEEATQEVVELVAAARQQLKIAELLGYGDEAAHARFREQIAQLEAKLGSDQESGGLFAKLRASLDRFEESFFN